VEGVDLRDEFARLIKLRTFGGKTGKLVRRPPEFVISKRSQVPTSRYGVAEDWRNRITICTYPGLTLADARETLLHELVHIFVGSHHGHDAIFKITMTKAFKEAYKVLPVGAGHNIYHGRYAEALRRREKAGHPTPPPRPVPKTKRPKATKTETVTQRWLRAGNNGPDSLRSLLF
jgi:hypothetical protein